MDISVDIDLGQAARELKLPAESVLRTVELLDDGNTVPFITRFRKDQTGALDEEQIRLIHAKVGKMRLLAERKQTILKSIESQGKLLPRLAAQIRSANTPKRLEDLYLPYKPKKQALASVARQRGLEPLAREILEIEDASADLEQAATRFLDPEQGLASVDDVLTGVGHILAEWFNERVNLREALRRILHRTGKLVCKQNPSTPHRAHPDAPAVATPVVKETPPAASTETGSIDAGPVESGPVESDAAAVEPASGEAIQCDADAPTALGLDSSSPRADEAPATCPPETESPIVDAQTARSTTDDSPVNDPEATQSATSEAGERCPDDLPTDYDVLHEGQATITDAPTTTADDVSSESPDCDQENEPPQHNPPVPADEGTPDVAATDLEEVLPATPSSDHSPVGPTAAELRLPESPDPAPPAAGSVPTQPVVQPSVARHAGKRTRGSLAAPLTKREKKRQKLEAAFKDYFEFEEAISKVPPHRILAVNRGERARILRVKIEADQNAMIAAAEKQLIREDHPFAEFLRVCVRDALVRLLIPSLEREQRREMTDRAEQHAVEVFARNLRKLLLQPPVHGHRVLAIDPGFRHGCKLSALDEFGNVLGTGAIHIVGKTERITQGRNKLIKMIRQYKSSVVAIGNGSGCREAEQLVADVIGTDFKDEDVSFVITNEAGASVYSTSPLGREELPGYDPMLRSAVSIGRRLLDPLSELVKINPANIGVGMYQHDVKAKHLRSSLDAVVESCVNYVGVDVNTASPALLRYVSGLNQLTARRLCEYRAEHGPFRTREQFKSVPGFGDAAFVQAAGFLKITGGENALDMTWIHPESYDVARRALEELGCSEHDLANGAVRTASATPGPTNTVAAPASSDSEGRPDELPHQPPDPAQPSDSDSPSHDSPVPTSEQPDVVEGIASQVKVPPAPSERASPAESGPDDSQPTVSPNAVVVNSESTVSESTDSEPADSELVPVVLSSDAQETTESQPDGAGPVDSAPDKPAEGPAATEPKPARRLDQLVAQADIAAMAERLAVSRLLLRDILSSLARPGRDPREDLPSPIFRRGIVKLEDLKPGMRLSGTVLNVVDFGVFVDIGLPDSGLVHISRLADRYVRDPHDVVGIGDVLTVWIVDVDRDRRRVSLTAIDPEAKRTPRPSRRPRRRSSQAKGATEPRQRRAKSGRPHGERKPSAGRAARAQPPRKPKVIKPITPEMEEGKAPLRSFSDLMQFYQKKRTDDDN